MSSVNKVILIGNLGSDPEVRQTGSGQPVANMRIATSENYTDKSGQKVETTEWHTVTAWGKTAELCGQYLTKGRKVYIEGKIKTREYTDRDGNDRKAFEIVAKEVTFLGGGDGGGQRQGGGGGYNQQLRAQSPDRAPRQSDGGWNGNGGGSQGNQGDWGNNNGNGGGSDPIPF